MYTAYNLLEEDRNRFVNAAAADELFNGFSAPEGIDLLGRLQLNNPLWMILSLVAVALIVRWLLGRVERVWRFVGIAFLGAFIELFWTIYVSEQLQDGLRSAMNWLLGRTFVVATIDWWNGVVDALGWLGIPLDFSVSWLVGLFGSIGPVIVVPIAWLVVASVVLGHRLTPPERVDHPALRRVTRSVPDRVKRVGSSLLRHIRRPLGGVLRRRRAGASHGARADPGVLHRLPDSQPRAHSGELVRAVADRPDRCVDLPRVRPVGDGHRPRPAAGGDRADRRGGARPGS